MIRKFFIAISFVWLFKKISMLMQLSGNYFFSNMFSVFENFSAKKFGNFAKLRTFVASKIQVAQKKTNKNVKWN